MTQKEMILKHLKQYHTITPMQALEEYSVYRLAAVIKVLRDENYNINTTLIPHVNRFGVINSYAQYSLED